MKNKKTIVRIFVAVFILTAWCIYNFSGNLLAPVVIKKIKNATGTRVDLEKLQFRLNGEILLKNVSISPLQKSKPDNSILTAEKLEVDFSLLSFLGFNPQIKKIELKNFVLNAQYNDDCKQWNVLALKFAESKNKKAIPDFKLKNGVLKFSQITKGKETKTIECIIKNGTSKIKESKDKFTFELVLNKSDDLLDNNITVAIAKGQNKQIDVNCALPTVDLRLFESRCQLNRFHTKITADAHSINFEQANIRFGKDTVIDVNGAITDIPEAPAFEFAVKMKDLNMRQKPADNCFAHGSRIFEKFIPLLQVFLDNFNPQGLLDINVLLSGKAKELAKTKVSGYLLCKDVSMQYFEFPYLVENLAGKIDVTETSMNMKDLKARHGKVDITMNGYCDGFGETMKSRVVMSSNNMLLDQDLYAALLEHHKKLWTIFSPAGVVSGDFVYTAEPPDIRKMEIYADLLDVSIMCQYFPYAIGNITGRITAASDAIELSDIVSKQNGGTITMHGNITEAKTAHPVYNFNIGAENIAIDARLISAFPVEQKKFFSDFDLDIKGNAELEIHSVNNPNMPVDYLAQLAISGEHISHPFLPEKLSNIKLNANLRPTEFEIKSFDAEFKDSPVHAAGTIWTANEKNPLGYCMKINALNLALDSNTVGAVLGKDSAKLLDDFNFNGRVNVKALVGKNSPIACPEFEVAVECLSNTAAIKRLSMPLKDITGQLVLSGDSVKLANLSASLADRGSVETPARITLNGSLQLKDKAVKTADVSLKAVDISLDEKFGRLLGKVKKYYTSAEATGSFDVDLNKVVYSALPNGEKMLDVKGTMAFKNCSVGEKKTISDLYALCDVDAGYKSGQGLQRCNLDLNFQSFKIKDRTIENLKMPVVADFNSHRIFIERFVGDCLGGKISGASAVDMLADGKFGNYKLDMALSGLQTGSLVFPNDTLSQTGGMSNAELSIHGNLQQKGSALGRITVEIKGIKPKNNDLVSKIRDAVYQAVKKDMALNNIKIEAFIKGHQIIISLFDIYGATASLRGKGFYEPVENKLNVNFIAYSGAGKDEPNLFESLTAGLTPAVLKVDLTGSLESPQINVNILPILDVPKELLGVK